MAYGGILGQTSSGGKKVCRLVVGASTSGWTANDCDYLCDGTADNVEINAAIQALPDTGGEVIILDGTYNLTGTINVNKQHMKLSGNGTSTVLKKMSTYGDILYLTSSNDENSLDGVTVENLAIDGNRSTYSDGQSNYGIYGLDIINCVIKGVTSNHNNDAGIYLSSFSNTIVTGNMCSNNRDGICLLYSSEAYSTVVDNVCTENDTFGINVQSSDAISITGNTCSNNSSGINLSSGNNNTITGNTCNNNNNYGICLVSSNNNNTITGNTCNNNNNGINLSGSNNNTITGNTCNNNNYSGIYLNNSDNTTSTGNTCNNNNSGIYLSSINNNTITGNTCIRGTGQPSDYASSQYTIQLRNNKNNYNLIADNNIMGKNYMSEGGTSNTFVNNKYN